MTTTAEIRGSFTPLDSDDDEGPQQTSSGRQRRSPSPRPDKVKLTPLWDRRVRPWFALAESTFRRYAVADSRTKFDLVLPALTPETLENLDAVLAAADESEDPYEELKARLMALYTPRALQQINKVIYGPELGGRRPSQMMEAMLALLPTGEQAGLLFKGHFLARLPADMQDQVAVHFERMTARELAEFADHLWFARNAKSSAKMVAAAPPAVQQLTEDHEEEEEQPVAAMKPATGQKKKKQWPKKKSGGQGQHASKPAVICSKHRKFGADAYSCQDPENCVFNFMKPGN